MIRRERDQFGCRFAQGFGTAGAPAVVDADILPHGPAQLLQGLRKSRVPGETFRVICSIGREKTYTPHPLTLLRACRERPCRGRAAEQRHELASFQLIELHWVAGQRENTVRG